jgi:hypothetical protein
MTQQQSDAFQIDSANPPSDKPARSRSKHLAWSTVQVAERHANAASDWRNALGAAVSPRADTR